MFLIDGPKARQRHIMCSLGTFVYLIGGESGEKQLSDLWKFDFENV